MIGADLTRMSEPVSSLGRKIQDFITSSDDESDSGEDDIEYIGTLPGILGVTYVPHYLVIIEADESRRSSGSSHLRNSQTLWRNGQTIDSRSFSTRSGLTAWEEDTPDSSKVMRAFMRVTEEQAMVRRFIIIESRADPQREGRKSASDRRAQLSAIKQKARRAATQGEQERLSREDEEMAELLQGLVLQQERKEKELAEKFAERERKLWSVSQIIRQELMPGH